MHAVDGPLPRTRGSPLSYWIVRPLPRTRGSPRPAACGREVPLPRTRGSPSSRQQNKPDTAGIEQDDTPRAPPAKRRPASPPRNQAPPERRPAARLNASNSTLLQHAVPHTGPPDLRVRTPFHRHPAEHADRGPNARARAQRHAANGIQQTTVGRPSKPAPNPRIQRNARTTATARTRNTSSSRTRTFEYVPTTNRPKRRTDTRVAHARRAAHRRAPRTHTSPGESIEQYATPTGIERRRAPENDQDRKHSFRTRADHPGLLPGQPMAPPFRAQTDHPGLLPGQPMAPPFRAPADHPSARHVPPSAHPRITRSPSYSGGRGREPGYPGPPAQIRTCALTHTAPTLGG